MRYYVQISKTHGTAVATLAHAARLATDESDAAPRVYDRRHGRYLTGAEILLAAITRPRPQRRTTGA